VSQTATLKFGEHLIRSIYERLWLVGEVQAWLQQVGLPALACDQAVAASPGPSRNTGVALSAALRPCRCQVKSVPVCCALSR
jgi:hypothetical protein